MYFDPGHIRDRYLTNFINGVYNLLRKAKGKSTRIKQYDAPASIYIRMKGLNCELCNP